MSVGEITFRLQQRVEATVQKWGLFTAKLVPELEEGNNSVTWFAGTRAVEVASYCKMADYVLKGELKLFALENACLSEIPHWNRDSRTGVEAPLVFGKTLDYRDPQLVGDIKYLWEPNRHLQLVSVAQAYALSGDRRYLEGLAKLFTAWLEQCPYPLGPNWTSSLELGIRLINWSIVWQLIGGAKSPIFEEDCGRCLRERWLRSIYQHCHFINGHWSRYSSANNHLIGEAAGLFVASVTWPCWCQTSKWKERSYHILLAEALKQNAEDGVNREQAVSYQQFVLDFLILAGLAARAEGNDFPTRYWQRIEKMLEYLASIMDVAGNMPMIGDADDGYVVALAAQQKFCPYRSLLATGAVLFNRPEFLKKAGGIDDKTKWLLGEVAEKETKAVADVGLLPIRRSFPEGGYYILGTDLESPDEIRCIVDCGPLGYLSIAAHGHADALSLILSVGGHEFLVDPGTYAYHTKKEWRDYFRGTAAHNTVRIDGQDQSEPGGSFMWLKKAEARCEEWIEDDGSQRIVATHNGYQRLPDPVNQRRIVEFQKKKGCFLITDEFECSGTHVVERMWHFSEYCEVTINGRQLYVVNDGKTILIQLESNIGNEIVTYKGSEAPIFGWISRHFDSKKPITTVVERLSISGTTRLNAKIECG